VRAYRLYAGLLAESDGEGLLRAAGLVE